jgi:putative DNA primase/helicase
LTFEELCSKLDRVQGFGDRRKARCPAHDDQVVSLSLREVDDGKILLTCFAGCTPGAVVKAIGASMKDLAGNKGRGGEEVARYQYLDREGVVLYEKVRYEPKDFRFTPSGYKGERVPYLLPELYLNPSRRILWVEGEKDADRLWSEGFVVTTAGGVNDWRAEMAAHFVGRYVTIIPDNDDPGRAHARHVAAALAGIAKEVAICELPGLAPKGDVSDWLDAGKTADDLRAALRGAVQFGATAMQPMDTISTSATQWLWFPRIARGGITMVFGAAGLGKSTIMLDVIARLSRGDVMPNGSERQPVTKSVIVGIEGPPQRTREVLEAAGAVLGNVAIVRNDLLPDPAKGPLEQIPYLEAEMRKFGATVLFVDNVSEAFVAQTDTNNEYSVRASLRQLASFAERTGHAIVMISHPKKGAAFGDVKEAITGSQAFTNLPRTTLFVAPVKGEGGEDSGLVALAVAKSNLYAIQYVNTLSFELTSHELEWHDGHPVLSPPKVNWRGVVQRDAQRLLEDMRPPKTIKEDEREEGPGLLRARLALETLSIPATGMTWDEIVETLGGSVGENRLRQIRSAYLSPVGGGRAGVRWFQLNTDPSPSVSPPPIVIGEENTSFQPARFPKQDATVEKQTTYTALPPTSAVVPKPDVTVAKKGDMNRDGQISAVPQTSAVPATGQNVLGPQSSAERLKTFLAAESTDQFLARMARGGVDRTPGSE